MRDTSDDDDKTTSSSSVPPLRSSLPLTISYRRKAHSERLIQSRSKDHRSSSMTPKNIFIAVVLSLGSHAALGFTAAPASIAARVQRCERNGLAASVSDDSTSRRDALSKVAALLSVPALLGTGLPAYADVSDGNALPQGAAQFGRVIRAKSDMIAVAKRVSEGSSEMDKTEWNNVGQFLRKVYSVAEDMKAIAGGFDPEKKKKAATLIEDLKKYSKAADVPTGTGNGPEFLGYAKKITNIFDEFLDLMSDVPDEI